MGRRSRYCLLVVVLFLVPAAPVSAVCSNTDSCQNQPDCDGCTLYDHVPDPSDCTRYYMCNDNENAYAQVFYCNPGEVFNIKTRLCDTTTACTICDPVCVYDCLDTSNPHFVSSRDDCTLYHDCSSSPFPPPLNCPDGTFFDGLSCQADQSRCCRCNAYCDSAPSMIADPLDCRMFYVCTAVGTPTDWTACPDGEYFNSDPPGCSDTVSCNTACQNLVGDDGCIDPFTCQETGYFAKCPGMCTPEFYYCSEVTDVYPDVSSCSSGVFHPDSHTCVSLSECL